MDIPRYNSQAWDYQVKAGNRWTLPVSGAQIAAARAGKIAIVLTPTRPVPADWFPQLSGCNVLCLAGGGGQQGPILSAAGANVTVFDNSPLQLNQDRQVAAAFGLDLKTVAGDMRDLSQFENEAFDLVFHPCSISFVPELQPVWNEVFRVLRPGGTYLLGACNPIVFVFDHESSLQGKLVARHSIPYSDLTSLTSAELDQLKAEQEPLCFGHSLEAIIGGQLATGLQLTGFFEDSFGDDQSAAVLDRFLPTTFATRAIKPE